MKKLTKLINIIICFVLIFGIYKIIDLQDQIDYLRSNISSLNQNLRNDMNNIYSNVNNMLEEESNQLSINKWEFESIDIKNRTVEISCIIIPKEYNPKTTKVKIINEQNEYLLDYANGQYITNINIPLFETTEFNQVQIDDNGTIRTQNLEWYISPKYEALIQTFVSFSGHSSSTLEKNEQVWNYNGRIDFDIDYEGTFDIKKIELVETIDGKEVNRYLVDITAQGQKKYAEELAKKNQSIPENIGNESASFYKQASFIYPLIKEISIPSGSEYVLYADITDENNLIHRNYFEYVPVKDDGRIDDGKLKEFEDYRFSETHMILDENGNILYTIDSQLFK